MRAGELRHRLTIQSRSVTRDETGQELESWSDVATVWGSIEPLSGREAVQEQAIHSETTHKVVLRHRDISMEDRLVFGSRRFHVLSVLNTGERNIETVLLCRERT